LQALGWNLVPILNNRAAITKHLYSNGGTEDWFNLKNLIVRKCLILPQDTKLEEQVCGRHYTYKDNNKIQLESKKEAKANGRPSPDRADSLILSFINYNPPDIADVYEYRKSIAAGTRVEYKRITQEQLVEVADDTKFAEFGEQLKELLQEKREARRIHGQEAWIDLAIKEHNRLLGN
jgi:hypothetical protein